MTKLQFNKIMEEVRNICNDGPVSDEAAYNMAEFSLWENPGRKEYLQGVGGARDVQGWLADNI